MTTAITTTLIALLARWDDAAADAARKLENSGQPVQEAFYASVMFGIEQVPLVRRFDSNHLD